MKKAIANPVRIVSRVWHSRFARSVAVVASGTAAAQAITVAFSPLITRIYGPEAFGLLGMFTAVISVAAPIAALSYPIAIVLPKDEGDALRLAQFSGYLAFAMATVVAIGLLAGGDWLVSLLSIEPIGGYIYLIPLVMLFSAWTQITRQWLIRNKEFGVIAKAAMAHSLILNSAKSSIGWFHPYVSVLIMLAASGQLLHAILLSTGTMRRQRQVPTSPTDTPRPSITELAWRYRDFPVYRCPQVFINAASVGLPVLMLGALFGPASAGFYTLGKTVMGLPSALIGKAVADVFYPKISEAAYAGRPIGPSVLKGTFALLALGLVPFGSVIVFGPGLFEFLFGPEWAIAGEYARWLAVFFLFKFVNKPSVAAVPVLGIQGGLLIYEIFSTGGKAIGLLVGFFFFKSEIWAIALFSLTGVIAYVTMMIWIYSHALQWDRNAETG